MIIKFFKKSKLKINLKERLEIELVESYSDFIDCNLEFVDNFFDSFYQVVFENLIEKEQPYQLNKKIITGFIERSRVDCKVFVKESNRYIKDWWNNDIYFSFIKDIPEISNWGSTEFWEYRKWRDDLEYECESLYYENFSKQELFKKYQELNLFDDFVFSNEKLDYYKKVFKPKFNKKIWLEFVNELIEIFFPQFVLNKSLSDSKQKFYLKKIDEDLWFGFEYNQKQVAADMGVGDLTLPDHLNLIIVSSKGMHNKIPFDTQLRKDSDIISLGILGNPFFYDPCYKLIGYLAIDSDKHRAKVSPQIRPFDENNSQFINPNFLGERAIRHSIFYMDLLSSTSSIYLVYLEKAIIKASK